MQNFSLSDHAITVDTGQIATAWDRSFFIREGKDTYFFIKTQLGSLQNGQPSKLYAFQYSEGKLVDVTATILPNESLFAITRDVLITDLNGDGYKDFFLSNQGPEPDDGKFPGERQAAYIYQPNSKVFTEVLINEKAFGHGSTFGDFDGDGAQEIFLNTLGSMTGVRSYVAKTLPDNSIKKISLDQNLINNIGPLNTSIDTDKDGKSEIASIDPVTGAIVIWKNILTSNPEKTILVQNSTIAPQGVLEIRSADFDGNGAQDLMVFGTGTDIQNSSGTTVGGKLKLILCLDAGLPTQKLVFPLIDNAIATVVNGGLQIDVSDLDKSGTQDAEIRTWDADWRPLTYTIFFDHSGKSTVKTNIAGSGIPRGSYADLNGDGVMDLIYPDQNAIKLKQGSISDSLGTNVQKFNFQGIPGDNTFLGGPGNDTIKFDGARAKFKIASIANNIVVTKSDAAVNSCVLTDIERLTFDDCSVAFDVNGVAGNAYRIYKAAFNRTPDAGGLGYWIGQMDAGMGVVEVAARFIDSPEFRSLYGQNPTNAQFLTKVYSNVLARTPDEAGLSWWVNEMKTNPTKSWQKVLADFSESAENQANVASLIANGISYDP